MEKIVLEFNTNINEVSNDIENFKKELNEVSKTSFGKNVTKEVEKIEKSINDLKKSDLGVEEKGKELLKLNNKLKSTKDSFNTLQQTQSNFIDTIKNSSIGVAGFQVSLGGLQAGFTAFKAGILSSIVSLQAFKMSLISTGIGAIVVLIGTLITSFTTFTTSTQEGSDKMGQIGAKLTAVFKPFYDLLVNTGRVLFSIVEGAIDALNYVTGTEKLADTMADTVKSAQQLEKTNSKLNTQADRELETQETLKNIRDDENQTLEARLKVNNELLVSINKEFNIRRQVLLNSIKQIEAELAQNRNAIGAREKEIELDKLKGELSKGEADRQGKINEQITNRVSLQRELNELALESQGINLEIMKVQGFARTGDDKDVAMRQQMAQFEAQIKFAEIRDALRVRITKDYDESIKAHLEGVIMGNEEGKIIIKNNLVKYLSQLKTTFSPLEEADIALSGGKISVPKDAEINKLLIQYTNYNSTIYNMKRELEELSFGKGTFRSSGELERKIESEYQKSLQVQVIGQKLQLQMAQINKDRLDALQKAQIDTLESNLKIKETELESIEKTDIAYLQKQMEILELKREIDGKSKFWELQLKGNFDANLAQRTRMNPNASKLSLDEYDKYFKALEVQYKNSQKKINDEYNTNVATAMINSQIDVNNQIIALNDEFSQERIKAERDNLTLEFALKMVALDTNEALYLQKLKTLQEQQTKALKEFDDKKIKAVLDYDLMINNMRISNYKDFQSKWLELQLVTIDKEAEIRKLGAKSKEEIDLIELERLRKSKNADLQYRESYENNVINAHLFTAEQIAKIDGKSVEGKVQIKQVEAQLDIEGMQVASQVFGASAQMANKQSEERKALLIAQATLETTSSAMSAFAMGSKLGGVPLGITMASLATGIGLANIAKIVETPAGSIEGGEDYSAGLQGLSEATIKGGNTNLKAKKLKLAKLATGGLVNGIGTSTSDSIPALLSNGESVINARSTQMFKPLLSQMNQAGGGKSFGNDFNATFIKDANKGKKQNDSIIEGFKSVQLGVSVKEINNVNSRITAKQTSSKL